MSEAGGSMGGGKRCGSGGGDGGGGQYCENMGRDSQLL